MNGENLEPSHLDGGNEKWRQNEQQWRSKSQKNLSEQWKTALHEEEEA